MKRTEYIIKYGLIFNIAASCVIYRLMIDYKELNRKKNIKNITETERNERNERIDIFLKNKN